MAGQMVRKVSNADKKPAAQEEYMMSLQKAICIDVNPSRLQHDNFSQC